MSQWGAVPLGAAGVFLSNSDTPNPTDGSLPQLWILEPRVQNCYQASELEDSNFSEIRVSQPAIANQGHRP